MILHMVRVRHDQDYQQGEVTGPLSFSPSNFHLSLLLRLKTYNSLDFSS